MLNTSERAEVVVDFKYNKLLTELSNSFERLYANLNYVKYFIFQCNQMVTVVLESL